MELKELMEGFAAATGLEGLEPDDGGAYGLQIDGMSVTVCEADDAHVALLAAVGEPPPDAVAGRERLYRTLLESAHLGRGTAGASFSIDEATGEIFLTRLESAAALDPEGFRRLLGDFANALAEWRQIVADFRPLAGQVDEDEREAAEESRAAGMGAEGFLRV